MPSLRPPATSSPPDGAKPRLDKPHARLERIPARAPERDDESPLTEAEERARAGGFHESSYELRTGMDMFESDWPDDTTLPGALDER